MINLDGLSYFLKHLYTTDQISWDGLYDYHYIPQKAIAVGSYYFNIKSEFVFPYFGLTDLVYLLFSVIPTRRIYLLKKEFPYHKFTLNNLNLSYHELNINIDELSHIDISAPNCDDNPVFLISRPNSIFGFSVDLNSIEYLLNSFPNTLIIVDEAYQTFSSEQSALSLINKYNNLVCLRTASKEFSMPSIRLAWLFTQNDYLLSLIAKRTFNTVSRLSEIFIEELVMKQRKTITENIIYIINERGRMEQKINRSLLYGESHTCMILTTMKYAKYQQLKEICHKQELQPLFLNDLEIYKKFMEDDGNYYVRFNVWNEEVNNKVVQIMDELYLT